MKPKRKKRMPYREIRKLKNEVRELRDLREYRDIGKAIYSHLAECANGQKVFNVAWAIARFKDALK